jgi:hypothetical protein
MSPQAVTPTVEEYLETVYKVYVLRIGIIRSTPRASPPER